MFPVCLASPADPNVCNPDAAVDKKDGGPGKQLAQLIEPSESTMRGAVRWPIGVAQTPPRYVAQLCTGQQLLTVLHFNCDVREPGYWL